MRLKTEGMEDRGTLRPSKVLALRLAAANISCTQRLRLVVVVFVFGYSSVFRDAVTTSQRQQTTIGTLRPSKVLALRLAAALEAESTASNATNTYPTPGFSASLVVLGRGMCTDLTLPNFSHSSCGRANDQAATGQRVRDVG